MKRLTPHSSVCHLVVLLVIIFLNKTKELPFVLNIPFFGQDFRQELEADKITAEQYNDGKFFTVNSGIQIINMDSSQIIEYFLKKSEEYESKYGQPATKAKS